MNPPKKTKEMSWTRLGNSYVLVDPDSKENITLDPIAFMVWVQCDGETTIESMTDVFSVDGNRDVVQAALKGILEKLEKNGLIEWNK